MLFSIATPIVVFVVAFGASYLITRPIGGLRRHIAATVLSLGLGAASGFATATIAICVLAALAGAFLGMVVSWRRRDPALTPPQQRERHQNSKRSHYHGERHA